jgi:hypothetical protein
VFIEDSAGVEGDPAPQAYLRYACAVCADDMQALERAATVRADQHAYGSAMVNVLHETIAGADDAEGRGAVH